MTRPVNALFLIGVTGVTGDIGLSTVPAPRGREVNPDHTGHTGYRDHPYNTGYYYYPSKGNFLALPFASLPSSLTVTTAALHRHRPTHRGHMTHLPTAFLVVHHGHRIDDHTWPRSLLIPHTGHLIQLDHGGEHAEQLVVTEVHHVLAPATGDLVTYIHAIPEDTP
jgi:hypothetical protein